MELVWLCPSSLRRWSISLLEGFTDSYNYTYSESLWWKLFKNHKRTQIQIQWQRQWRQQRRRHRQNTWKYLKCSQPTQFVSTKEDSTHLYRINTLARFNTDETFTRLTAFKKNISWACCRNYLRWLKPKSAIASAFSGHGFQTTASLSLTTDSRLIVVLN